MSTTLSPARPTPEGRVAPPSEATSNEALRAQADFTRRRLERNAGELLHELKPTSLIRTQLGGHSDATVPEIGSQMLRKLKNHPVIVSSLVTVGTSLLLAGDEARPGRSHPPTSGRLARRRERGQASPDAGSSGRGQYPPELP